jgi:glyoxylase-like metal-dependent hydrolase (beta-lactamase superfamily II)/predicted ester cyclase
MAATDATTRDAGAVARDYFNAVRRGDPTPQRENYAPDAVIEVPGILHEASPGELIAYFEQMWAAFPDFRFEVLDIVAEGDRAACHWRITGTFAGPGRFNDLEPTGARVDQRGVDYIEVRDGRIVRNDAYTDGITLAQQLGVLPPNDSRQQQRMTQAINARTRLGRKVGGGQPEEVADGVWRVQGQPGRCNVYLLRDGDGVLMFDAGARTMAGAVGAAAASLGGLTRIVLGHGHTDHRGTAPSFDVPVYCHPDEVVDAEGSGGWRYWDSSLSFLPFYQRPLHKLFHAKAWDGGPVKIAGTVSEGDDVAGFRVVHVPGHAPGLIALWRESDRVALTSDVFYTLDMWGRDDAPHLPMDGYNLDTAQARESLLKVAALEPAVAFPGHASPVTGDVRGQLERSVAVA